MNGRIRDGAEAIITSRANARIKQLRAAMAGNARLSGGLAAIEGDTLLEEALRSGIVPRAVFLTSGREALPTLPPEIEVLRCSVDVLQSALDTQSPQGIAALIEPRIWSLNDAVGSEDTPPLLLVAVHLQDPGNLGTLIRSAEAFGATGLLATEGTVSPWNPKALRASAGSVFRLPAVFVTSDQILALKLRGIRLLAAVAEHGHAAPASMAGFAGPSAIMIGNEGSGLSPEYLALADGLVTIPTPGPVESLNAAVAGSILLYEASRQRGTL